MSNKSAFSFLPSAYPTATVVAIHQNEHGASITCDVATDDPLLHLHVATTGSSKDFPEEILCKPIVDIDATLIQMASKRKSTYTALTSIGEGGHWLYIESVTMPPLKHVTVVPRPSSNYAVNFITQAMWALRKVIRGINDGSLKMNGELIRGLILPSALSSDIGTVAMRKAMLEAGGRCLAPYSNAPETKLTKVASVVGAATIVLRFNRGSENDEK